MRVVPLSRAARRWQEIVNDPELSQGPERIETDARGQVMIAPPPDSWLNLRAVQGQLPYKQTSCTAVVC
jgi:hypothetical protein